MPDEIPFGPSPSNDCFIIPVIHSLSVKQVARNIEIAIDAGVNGIFLINHDFGIDKFLPIIREVRTKFPRIWMGVNFLSVTGKFAFPILAELETQGYKVNAYWADNACIAENTNNQFEADEIANVRLNCGWRGLYFGGVAFKKQRQISKEHFEDVARRAAKFMDVITTSGAATGEAADLNKVSQFRKGAGKHPIAVASGISWENINYYSSVNLFLVATGINIMGDFYNICPNRLRELITLAKDMECC